MTSAIAPSISIPTCVEAALEAALRLGFDAGRVRNAADVDIAVSFLGEIARYAVTFPLQGNRLSSIALAITSEAVAARAEFLDLVEACGAAAEAWTGIRRQEWNPVRPRVRVDRDEAAVRATTAAARVTGDRVSAWNRLCLDAIATQC